MEKLPGAGLFASPSLGSRLLTYPTEPVIYLPIYQAYRSTQDTTIHLRTTGDPRAMASSVEETIHQGAFNRSMQHHLI
jgi:hypothetical protein